MKNLLSFLLVFLLQSPFVIAQENAVDYQESVILELPETAITSDYIFFKAYIYSNKTTATQPTSAVLNIVLKDSTDTVIKTQYHAITDGVVDSGIKLPKKRASGAYTIEAYTQWMQNYDYSKNGLASICIDCENYPQKNNPLEQPTIRVEGGVLVDNIPSKIIVNSPVTTDLSSPLLGTIVDSNDQFVSTVNRLDTAFGAAVLTPKHGESYYFKSTDGTHYELPDTANKGFVININNLNDDVFQLRITSSEGEKNKKPTLQAYTKGLNFIYKKLDITNGTLIVELPKSELPQGLVEFYLVDDAHNVLSYRPISIVASETQITTEILSQNEERTLLKIKVVSNQKEAANFPIAIAGYKSENKAALNYNHKSYDRKQRFINDLLVLTAHTPKDLKELKIPSKNGKEYPIQKGLSLVGTAYDLNNKILRNEQIEVLASSDKGILIEEVVTNDAGILSLHDLKVIGRNQIIFRKKAEDLKSRLIQVTPIDQANVKGKQPVVTATKIETINAQLEKEKNSLPFDLTNTEKLTEIELNGKNKKNSKGRPSNYGVEAPISRTSYQDYERPKTIAQLLQSIPNIIVFDDPINPSISVPSAVGSILFVIDGFPLSQGDGGGSALLGSRRTSLNDLINMVNAADVERIEFLIGAGAAIYGSRAAGGVLQVYTRNGGENRFVSRKKASLTFQGYEQKISFDAYWNDLSRNNKRNTDLLYWNSNITLDNNGEAIVDIPNYGNELLKSIKVSALAIDGSTLYKNIID